MLIVTKVHIPEGSGEDLAAVARGFLSGVVLNNRLLIRHGLVPRLYESGVRWRNEPWRNECEEFADAVTCLERGWGDCEDLSAWLIAECHEAGETDADFRIYGRSRTIGGVVRTAMHVEVR